MSFSWKIDTGAPVFSKSSQELDMILVHRKSCDRFFTRMIGKLRTSQVNLLWFDISQNNLMDIMIIVCTFSMLHVTSIDLCRGPTRESRLCWGFRFKNNNLNKIDIFKNQLAVQYLYFLLSNENLGSPLFKKLESESDGNPDTKEERFFLFG